jgi:hypothetical protein
MQASVLTVSSYATRTSPVLRGKWVLENLLNAAPPPPPPTVPRLDESAVGTTTTLRQQMDLHRKDPDLRLVPPPDGSTRFRPRKLRRHRPVADRRRQVPD